MRRRGMKPARQARQRTTLARGEKVGELILLVVWAKFSAHAAGNSESGFILFLFLFGNQGD